MKRTISIFIGFTVMIGVVALALNTALGNQTVTFLERIRYQVSNTHFYYYKFTWWNYLKNIEMSTSDISILKLEMPTRTWINITSNILENQFWADLSNNLALMLDYVIMVINILLYPLKIGAYLLRNILAILGVNQDVNNENNGLGWLARFINEILGRISIPYI